MSYSHFRIQSEAPGFPYEFEAPRSIVSTPQDSTPEEDLSDKTRRIAQEQLSGSTEVCHPQAQRMVLATASVDDDDQMGPESYPAPSFFRIDGSFSAPPYTEEEGVGEEGVSVFFHRPSSTYTFFDEGSSLLAQSPPPIGLWQTDSTPPVLPIAFSLPTRDPRQIRAITPAPSYSHAIPKVAAQAIMGKLSQKELANFASIRTYGRRRIPPMKPLSPLKISEIVADEN